MASARETRRLRSPRKRREMITYLLVAIGSALGGVARYGCSSLLARTVGETFPWGTLAVNVVGSFVIGLFTALTGPEGRILVAPDARIFVTVGFCGGFTTFSSFSIQTLSLMRSGELGAAGLNAALSLGLCLLTVWAGFAVGLLVSRAKGG
jgi:CrcB protein